MRARTTTVRLARRLSATGALGILLTVGASAAMAAPGSLDGSFGSGGGVQFGAGSQLFGVAPEADGGAVVAGESGGRVLVERLNAAGHVLNAYHGPAGFARGVAVAPDGTAAAAGTSNGAMFVVRLSGTLAPTSTSSAFAGQGGIAYSVAIAPTGGVVAAGSVSGATGTQSAIAQFAANGATQWTKVYAFGGNSLARGVAVQPADSKVVLVGSQSPGLQVTNGFMARLTTSGNLDGGFGSGGALTYSLPTSGFTALNAVALQSNGRIVAAGAAALGPTALVLRFNGNGSLDSSFGHGGVTGAIAGQNVAVPAYPIGAYAVGIAGGGAIVAAGNYENTGVSIDNALYGFTAGGALATNFGSGGTVRNPMGTFESCGIAVVPNGNLVTVGNIVTTLPDAAPCTPSANSAAFALRFVGLGPIPVVAPPALKVGLKLGSSFRKSTARHSGVPFTVTCNVGCGISGTLTASAGTARQLKLSTRTRRCTTSRGHRRCVTTHTYRTTTLGTARTTLSGAGSKALSISARSLRSLTVSRKSVKLSLRIVVTATATRKQSVTTRTLTFR